jgi:hypothetical protein
LQWNPQQHKINTIKSSGEVEVFAPEIENDIKTYIKHPEDMEDEFFKNGNNIDTNNISFN